MLLKLLRKIINYSEVNKKSFLGPSDIYMRGAISPVFHLSKHNLSKDIDKFYYLSEEFTKSGYNNQFEPIEKCLLKLEIDRNEITKISTTKSYSFYTITITLNHFFQPNEFKFNNIYYVIFPLANGELKIMVCYSNKFSGLFEIMKNSISFDDSNFLDRELFEDYSIGIFNDVLENLNKKVVDSTKSDSIKLLFDNIIPKLNEKEIDKLVKLYSKTIKNPKKLFIDLEEEGYIDEDDMEEFINDRVRINYEFIRHNIVNYEDDWKIDIKNLQNFIFDNCNIDVSNIDSLGEINEYIANENFILLNLDSGIDRYNLIIINKSQIDNILKISSDLIIPLGKI